MASHEVLVERKAFAMTIGGDSSTLDTPVMWVDLDLMERNIAHLSSFFRHAGVGWRPHIKGIKVPEIALLLVDAGAIGVTCAKLSEAEVMAAAGIGDILIANQVVGPVKMARLANLRRETDVMVAVDSIENAQEISQAASIAGAGIRILVEVDSGLHRCGVQPGQPAVDLATRIEELPGLQVAGVMAWEGHTRRIADPDEKERACKEAVGSLVQSGEAIRAAGLEAPIVSCGGSGTHRITSHIPGVTEIQAGGAIFSDVAYRSWGVETDCSLFVRATVVSRPTRTRAVVDAGFKAMSGWIAMPEPRGVPGARLAVLDAEHGIMELDSADVSLQVGDKIDFIIGYGDTTVYMHDHLLGMRHGRVETLWDVQARGKLT
jgi:D-serine deaminase-like pyridoxal phosphate-dependent protein